MSTHEDFRSRIDVRRSSDRNFGFVFAVFFLLLGFSPLLRHGAIRMWPLVLSGAFLLVSLSRPSLLSPLNRFWSSLGDLLGRIMNPIVTAMLFFLVITPVGLLMRMLGKDLLKLRYDSRATTYWVERAPVSEPDSMSRQF